MSFDKLDTSHWHTKDKAWKEERLAQWPAIEEAVSSYGHRKTEINLIKQYFLRGKLPAWEKYRDWDSGCRALDLRMFLWLYPSEDPQVLKAAYHCYMESDEIQNEDISVGYSSFLGSELKDGTREYNDPDNSYKPVFMWGKNIILFRIMFEDLDYMLAQYERLIEHKKEHQKERRRKVIRERVLEAFDYLFFRYYRRWLLMDKSSSKTKYCLYQYDEVIDWLLTTITPNADKEFVKIFEENPPVNVPGYQKALYCIYHFDTEKEGDTPRSAAVIKIRKILDEREFVPEFKQMWQDVKAGKVEVDDPWNPLK